MQGDSESHDGESTRSNPSTRSTRSIRVEAMTRVEGEGGLDIILKGGQVDAVRLRIFEPPRFFEAFLRGRPLEEVPDITARICGICPVAYQMSSVHALERALGVTASPEVSRLRRLLYCGEWIESHALHVHMLNLPDFFGHAGAIEMAAQHPEWVGRGLQLKRLGNQLLEMLGGRAIHPINVAVGGFYRAPTRGAMAELVKPFETGLALAEEAARFIADLDYPAFDQQYDFVSLVHPDEYPMNEGDIVSSDGLSIPNDAFLDTFVERQVPHSTALQAVRIDTGKSYLVGPPARFQNARQQLSPRAKRLADELDPHGQQANPFRAILARSIELVHAFEEAVTIMKSYAPVTPPRLKYDYREGVGGAATEAPRGLLFHRYRVDAEGKVVEANIIPPTSQNQSQIETDLRDYLPQVIGLEDAPLADACERLVRCYDPCISCSTHFLKVRIDRS